jgi:hypothetical protein
VQREGGGDEQRIFEQGADDHLADLAGDGMIDGELLVVFDERALVAGGGATVDPVGGFEQSAALGELFGREDIGNIEDQGEGER